MPGYLAADDIRHGIALGLPSGSLQAPLPVAAGGGVFLPGDGAPVGTESGLRPRAEPPGGGQGIQNVDGSADAARLSQAAGTMGIENLDHNDRFYRDE